MEHLIVIRSEGTVDFLYDDALRPFLECGSPTICRSSNVEPTPDARWSVDLSPLGGGLLGPFEYRQEALTAEAAWIKMRL